MSMTLRISTPGDLLAAVPQVLGFQPERSLVVMGVGPGAMCARVDHPMDSEEVGEASAAIVPALVRNGVGSVVLVSFVEDSSGVVEVVAGVRAALSAAGVRLVDAVVTVGGRWWQVGSEGLCGPAEGTAYDVGSHPLTAQSVFAGRAAPVANREALVASLTGTPDSVDGLVGEVTRVAGLDAAGRRDEALWLRGAMRDAVGSGERLPVEVSRRVFAALLDVGVRDVVWADISRESAVGWVAVLRDLLRRAPAGVGAPVAGLLAFAAWMRGDGALSWCAVDRCLELDPDYALAHLVGAALSGAVPPQEWEPLTAEDLPVLAG